MELSEEEKKAIEDSKELINDLEKRKDKDFIGRLYYKNRPIEDILMILLNIIERCQEEIDTWEETENDYEHELARKDEEIEEMLEELEIQKRLIIEQIKRFCELYNPKEGIGEGGLDELAEKILSFSKDYISKDKIREKIKELETLYNCNLDTALTSYEMFCFVRSYIDKVKNILKEFIEENNEESNTL